MNGILLTLALLLSLLCLYCIVRINLDEQRASEAEEALKKQKAENKKLIAKLNDKHYVIEIKTIGY